MMFDMDLPSVVGEMITFPDWPFINRAVPVANDTTYIQASAATIQIQASAGIPND